MAKGAAAAAPAAPQSPPAGSHLSVIQKVVAYHARDGEEVTLSVDIVKNFLVSGKKELVTHQEFIYFIGICKARGMNPFAKDCYLIKYSNDPAQIITSIDFYRSRARAQADCVGWEKGVICLNAETGEIRYSKGLVLPGEKLLGGWFKAQPKGWDMPFELEVNLDGYIKYTSNGEITKFWQPANQPTMIAKVAESQGLRALWPDEFRGTITAEEAKATMETFETIDIHTVGDQAASEQKIDTSAFDGLLAGKNIPPERQAALDTFLAQCAEVNSRGGLVVTADHVKVEAAKRFDAFWKTFEDWEKKQPGAPPVAPQGPASATEEVKQPEVVEGGSESPGDPPGPPPDLEALKKQVEEIKKAAVSKGIYDAALKQFKADKFEDFLAWPDMIPTLQKFVDDAQTPPKK